METLSCPHPRFIEKIFSQKYTQKPFCLLLRGETGSGKTAFSKGLHRDYLPHSPFVHLNMAALPENLIESELFGYKRGAFTGAEKNVAGKVALANHGLLFLDEIGELPLALQGKLLTFLDNGEYYPLGGSSAEKFCGKIVFATNQNLEEKVQERKFRKDLYFRLRNFQFVLPSLKERQEEIPSIFQKMLRDLSFHYNFNAPYLSENFIDWLKNYSWPGNYRELKSLAEFVLFNVEGETLHIHHLPEWLNDFSCKSEKREFQSRTYPEAFREFEENYLTRALNAREGRINLTAREIGMSKTTLIAKVRKYGIKSGAS